MPLEEHAERRIAAFRDRFWVSLALAVPIVLLHVFPASFPGSRWLPLALGTIIFFYGGTIFLVGAWRELAARRPGMMTLVALAIISGYWYSVATTFFIVGDEFFWELGTLVTIMLLGHWIERRSIASAQGALKDLEKLLPDTAELADGGAIVPVAELRAGAVILVRPGGDPGRRRRCRRDVRSG